MIKAIDIGVVPGCAGCRSLRGAVQYHPLKESFRIVEHPMAPAYIEVLPGSGPESTVDVCPSCREWWSPGLEPEEALTEYLAWEASRHIKVVENAACLDCCTQASESVWRRGSDREPVLTDHGKRVLPSNIGGDLVCERHERLRINNPEYDEDFWEEETEEKLARLCAKEATVIERFQAS